MTLRKIKIINTLLFAAAVSLSFSACDEGTDKQPTEADVGSDDKMWRYFDREVYFPIGSSVAPEVAVAQDLVQEGLKELAEATDLGVDYFIFKTEEDSLLQPVVGEESYQGRNWRSFWQIWDDELFNTFVSDKVGTSGDQDVVVARNEKNDREFYVVSRLSCYVAGEGCLYPTQRVTKMLVWRSVGYLVGLKSGENAFSKIMSPGISLDQDSDEERKKFAAEFDGALERIRNEIPLP